MLKLINSRLSTRSLYGYRNVPLPQSHPRTLSSLMQRRPEGRLVSLMRALDDFDNTLSGRSSLDSQLTTFSPRFDFRETKDGYHLDGELPGVEKKDIEIEFTDQSTLSVKGHTEQIQTSAKSPEDTDGGSSWWCAERSTGDFRRSFSFPVPVDHDHVDATLKNGILSINIPKAENVSTGKRIDVH
ncbi:HSP20-like chaperone [Aspergillus pseudoustus]|uniref:HSP20-like chaperone n=1 Tax=Aspergillus pseudoustus TaxID=1810923 RepID=A0ABR4KW13_9EURO